MKVILDSNVFDDVVKGKIDIDIFEKNNIEIVSPIYKSTNK